LHTEPARKTIEAPEVCSTETILQSNLNISVVSKKVHDHGC